MVILTFEKYTYIFYITEDIFKIDSKIASSPTNVKGVHKYDFMFLFEDHISKPTYFIKSQNIVF